MKRFAFTLAATAFITAAAPLCAKVHAQKRSDDKGAWVFAYFKEPADQGIYLALSRDGLHYTPLNDGEPWLKPSEPDELMRAIYITRTPNGHGFRAVWTWGWRGNSHLNFFKFATSTRSCGLPAASLFIIKSSREMKKTVAPKRTPSTRFSHAEANRVPSMD